VTKTSHNCESYNCTQDCLIDEMSCNIYNVVLKYNRCQHCQHGKADNAFLKDAALMP